MIGAFFVGRLSISVCSTSAVISSPERPANQSPVIHTVSVSNNHSIKAPLSLCAYKSKHLEKCLITAI